MPNRTACQFVTLPRLGLSMLFAASLLIATARSARAQAQPPHAAPVTTAAPPTADASTTAPSPAIQVAITDAKAKAKAGQFADAIAALTAVKSDGLATRDKQALDFSLADVQAIWGTQLVNSDKAMDALPHLQVALVIDEASLTRRLQFAANLRREGVAYTSIGQPEKAIGYFLQSLRIFRALKNSDGEAGALNSLGVANYHLGKCEQAISYYQQALPIFRVVKDQSGDARNLMNLGSAYAQLSQYPKAIGYFEQALTIYRKIKDRNGVASDLNNIGVAYDNLSQYDKAIGFYKQALTILQEVKARNTEAADLVNLGLAYEHLSQYQNAINSFEKAAPILREVKNREFEANNLNSLGIAYDDLSQHEKAIGFYERALPLFRELKDRDGEAADLVNLGIANRSLSHYEKAVGFYLQALPILRDVKNRAFEANDLMNLGNAYGQLSQYRKAVDYSEQALAVYREINDRNGEADDLGNLGIAYDSLSQYDKAIGFYEQALAIHRDVKDRDGEAGDLTNLMSAWSSTANSRCSPNLAIFYGKQAVNVLQTIRIDIHGLKKQTQQGYLKSNEDVYRTVITLLIDQNRLPEALQVFDLLKQEEYLNFSKPTRGRQNAGALLARAADFTPREQRWDRALRAAQAASSRDSALLEELNQQKLLTKRQKLQFKVLTTRATADEAIYQTTLTRTNIDFHRSPDASHDRLLETSNTNELQAALTKLGHGSVALYTLVDDKSLRMLLVTSHRIVARDAKLKDPRELDKMIVAYRSVLQDPNSDPRPPGEQLYDLLIAPIRHDLDAAHAQTLLVSLDGNLRYIPLAALSPDGKHYLVESYRTVLYAPAAIANLTRQPKAKWTAVAMGVSEAPAGFAPLPAVPDELRSIVRTVGDTRNANSGVFPGVRLLNGTFTKAAMVSALAKDYPLVHIASHFVFTGDETTSFLLLGDGTHLTLSDLKALPDGIFAGVNLLTLSACETATGGIATETENGKATADGANSSRDVENVAVLAQRKGADAVMASLWSVSDESTGLLMRAFYRGRKGSGSPGTGAENKAEALRQAQLSLLTGASKSVPSSAPLAKRSEPLGLQPASVPKDAPVFTPDPAKPWAHPYYWAPFILIGNWK